MTTAATHHEQSTTTEATLFVAFELREKTWKLGCTTGHGQKPRERTVTALVAFMARVQLAFFPYRPLSEQAPLKTARAFLPDGSAFSVTSAPPS